ncbi:hypothetical protein HOH87_01210, partial [bacterium]|nr:hypothetical protein [bacterium]
YQRVVQTLMDRTRQDLLKALKRADTPPIKEFDSHHQLMKTSLDRLDNILKSSAEVKLSNEGIHQVMGHLSQIEKSLGGMEGISKMYLGHSERHGFYGELAENYITKPWEGMLDNLKNPNRATIKDMHKNFKGYISAFTTGILFDAKKTDLLQNKEFRTKLLANVRDILKEGTKPNTTLIEALSEHLSFQSRQSESRSKEVADLMRSLIKPSEELNDIEQQKDESREDFDARKIERQKASVLTQQEKYTLQNLGKQLLIATPDGARSKMILIMDMFRDKQTGKLNTQDLMSFMSDPDSGSGLYEVASTFDSAQQAVGKKKSKLLIKKMLNAFSPKPYNPMDFIRNDQEMVNLMQEWMFDNETAERFGDLYAKVQMEKDSKAPLPGSSIWDRMKYHWTSRDINLPMIDQYNPLSNINYGKRLEKLIAAAVNAIETDRNPVESENKMRGLIKFYLQTVSMKGNKGPAKIEAFLKEQLKYDGTKESVTKVLSGLLQEYNQSESSEHRHLTELIAKLSVEVNLTPQTFMTQLGAYQAEVRRFQVMGQGINETVGDLESSMTSIQLDSRHATTHEEQIRAALRHDLVEVGQTIRGMDGLDDDSDIERLSLATERILFNLQDDREEDRLETELNALIGADDASEGNSGDGLRGNLESLAGDAHISTLPSVLQETSLNKLPEAQYQFVKSLRDSINVPGMVFNLDDTLKKVDANLSSLESYEKTFLKEKIRTLYNLKRSGEAVKPLLNHVVAIYQRLVNRKAFQLAVKRTFWVPDSERASRRSLPLETIETNLKTLVGTVSDSGKAHISYTSEAKASLTQLTGIMGNALVLKSLHEEG